jgi:hypothetical protein
MSDEESVNWDLKEIRSKDPEVKWTAVNNLSKYLQSNPKNFRARMIVKSFLSMINDTNDNIRETIYSTLITTLTDSKGLETLIVRGLADSSPSIRSLSLEWLHTSNHGSVISETIKFLNDPSDAVKKTAMDIVLARDIKNIENQLLELLKHEKGVLRRSVIFALGKMKTSAAIDALKMIMKNPKFDDWTRNQASSALEHMGGTELIIPYIENLIDPNEYVRQTAAAFLKKNEKELESLILMKKRLDYLAFLQHGTDTTKQDFSQIITTLKSQMSNIIQTLTLQLQEKDVLVIDELVMELKIDPIAIKIILDKFLDIRLFPQPEERYFTNKGLKQILQAQFAKKNSLLISDVMKVKPFDEIELEDVTKLLGELNNIELIFQRLYLLKNDVEEIKKIFEVNGLINIGEISSNTHQPSEIIQNELVHVLVPNNDGWMNNRKEYITSKYIHNHTKEIVTQRKIIELSQFLKTIGNPKIDFSIIKQIIDNHTQGKWLDDINVFITSEKFKEIEENSIRIDEDRIKHLLDHINIKFPQFLASLQKILEIKTFNTKSGQLVSLESLFPRIQQEITEKSYFPIKDFLKENNLDVSLKSTIIEHLSNGFSGKTDKNADYFFLTNFLDSIKQECDNSFRINFSVLAFKLNITSELLKFIVLEILEIYGIHNNLGEFITFKGVEHEYNEVFSNSKIIPVTTLIEILDIEGNKKEIDKLIERVRIVLDLNISEDGTQVLSKKM